MTKEQAKQIVKGIIYQFISDYDGDGEIELTKEDRLLLEVNKTICNAIDSLDELSSDDCVSRTEAIEWTENLRQMDKCFGNYEDDYFPLSEVIDRLKNVPPVTPTCKVGKWIFHKKSISTGFRDLRECSCCKCFFRWEMPRNSYCPNCGAEMRGAENE